MTPDWSLSIITARQSLGRAENSILEGDVLKAITHGSAAMLAVNDLMLWLADELERRNVQV